MKTTLCGLGSITFQVQGSVGIECSLLVDVPSHEMIGKHGQRPNLTCLVVDPYSS